MPTLDYMIDVRGRKTTVMFKCPGCGRDHVLYTQDTPTDIVGPRWTFNGDYERPVLNPSILARWHSLSSEAKVKQQAFYKEHGRFPTLTELPNDVTHICHSFVGCNGAAPGQIIFLPDCTHDKAGQVVDLPQINPND